MHIIFLKYVSLEYGTCEILEEIKHSKSKTKQSLKHMRVEFRINLDITANSLQPPSKLLEVFASVIPM